MPRTAGQKEVVAIARKRAKEPVVRWWLENEDGSDANREVIEVSPKDAEKKPANGSTKTFSVTNLITGKRVILRRADCGLGCQCALERA